MSSGNRTPFNYDYSNLNEVDFILTRQHSLPATQLDQFHLLPVYHQGQNMDGYSGATEMNSSSFKTKHASIEIYRPPSIRMENTSQVKGKLNVHAKEFVMNSTSNAKSSHHNGLFTPKNFLMRETIGSRADKSYSLSPSKTSISVNMKTNSSQNIKSNNSKLNDDLLSSFNLQKAKSSGNMLTESNIVNPQKVQFRIPIVDKPNKGISKEKKVVLVTDQVIKPGNLKRSKSLNAADALKFMEMEASFSNFSISFTDYNIFPEEIQPLVKQAVKDVNLLIEKQKILLARYVIEYILYVRKHSSSVAKLSIIIMEKDNTGAYLDSLLNTCQMVYQKKETALFKDPTKIILFVTFLTEMYTELKHSKLQLKFQSDPVTPPKLLLLILISRCCEDILTQIKKHSLPIIECLFHSLTSVGRDLEAELPDKLKKLYNIVREVFLKSSDAPDVKKTLLQLIELKAANWQLPVSALNFYYSKSSN